jgi:hypothetical protein
MATTAPLPDKDQCAICKTETGLNSCKSCLVVFYCGRDHQKEDWATHKRFCKHAKMTRESKLVGNITMLLYLTKIFKQTGKRWST